VNLEIVEHVDVPVHHKTGAQLPFYASEGAAGADLRAHIDHAVTMEPGTRALIPTGLSVALPHGTELQIRPRSGLAYNHGITVLNSPGTIDCDYRGEVKVLLVNLGDESFQILPGMRIAQAVIAPIIKANWQSVTELPSTERGARGFGHTGSH